MYLLNQIYDDDADYLFRGAVVDGGAPTGLLYWSGTSSSKHDGQLKRICAPVISLLRSLVVLEFENENIFYERFVHCPIADLLTVNFDKHIEPIVSKKGGAAATTAGGMMRTSKITGSSRVGGAEDALELLAILATDHRSAEGENEVVDLKELLHDNKSCLDKVNQYMRGSKGDQVCWNTNQIVEGVYLNTLIDCLFACLIVVPILMD